MTGRAIALFVVAAGLAALNAAPSPGTAAYLSDTATTRTVTVGAAKKFDRPGKDAPSPAPDGTPKSGTAKGGTTDDDAGRNATSAKPSAGGTRDVPAPDAPPAAEASPKPGPAPTPSPTVTTPAADPQTAGQNGGNP